MSDEKSDGRPAIIAEAVLQSDLEHYFADVSAPTLRGCLEAALSSRRCSAHDVVRIAGRGGVTLWEWYPGWRLDGLDAMLARGRAA